MSLFKIKQANHWIESAKEKPTPRRLFGDLWLEGELSLLFASAGMGKSLLAVQIAESIARGRSIAPLGLEAGKQKVLYIDCELSDKQFEMRYAKNSGRGLVAHHRFSANFLRAEMELGAEKPKEAASFEEYAVGSISELIRETNAKVVVIDNMASLRAGVERAADAVRLMKALRRMRSELGISLLVLAHTPKRNANSALSVNDLQTSQVLAHFADNVFAIGRSRRDPAERYIKHIRPRSTELLYDESHVPGFRVERVGRFLGFSFTGFATESSHLTDVGDGARIARATEIKQLSSGGLTQRRIAAKLGISLGSVNRYLQMSTPPVEQDDDQLRTASPFEESEDHTDLNSLSLEDVRTVYLREAERADREVQFEEMLPKRYGGTLMDRPAASRSIRDPSRKEEPCYSWERQASCSTAESEIPFSPVGPFCPFTRKAAADDPHCGDPLLSKLDFRIDHMDREIWVEEERCGKPHVYYTVDSRDLIHRWERGFYGISGKMLRPVSVDNVSGTNGRERRERRERSVRSPLSEGVDAVVKPGFFENAPI